MTQNDAKCSFRVRSFCQLAAPQQPRPALIVPQTSPRAFTLALYCIIPIAS
jgi:hypothetical protein